MNKKDFLKLKKWGENLGVKIDYRYIYSMKDVDSTGEYIDSTIALIIKRGKKTGRVNWTDAILDLAHELGHHLDDIQVKKPNYKAHQYLPQNKKDFRYVPKWARKVILKHEEEADFYIQHILEEAAVHVTKRKVDTYVFENQYIYRYILDNRGKQPTYKHAYAVRRIFRRIYNEK